MATYHSLDKIITLTSLALPYNDRRRHLNSLMVFSIFLAMGCHMSSGVTEPTRMPNTVIRWTQEIPKGSSLRLLHLPRYMPSVLVLFSLAPDARPKRSKHHRTVRALLSPDNKNLLSSAKAATLLSSRLPGTWRPVTAGSRRILHRTGSRHST